MHRRSFLWLTSVVSLGALGPSRLRALVPSQTVDVQEQSRRLYQLAASVKTADDARILVDYVASLFSDSLPAAWSRDSIRRKIARAEFDAVSDPRKLIPEDRIAQVWSAYVETIQAPPERRVTEAEVHNLRDGLFTAASLGWAQGGGSIWRVPTIYASNPDGTLASGCRAIEAIRILYDLSRFPQNLLAARLRVHDGVLNSDLYRTGQSDRAAALSRQASGTSEPVYFVEREYVAIAGKTALYKAVSTMLDQALG